MPNLYIGWIDQPKNNFPNTYYDPTEIAYNSNNTYWWLVTNTAGGLLHEVGHWLFDDTHHRNDCVDHIMNQCGNCPRNYLNPIDLGEIHRSLSSLTVSKYVSNCPVATVSKVVTNYELIDFDYAIDREIVIEANGVLEITCTVRMPDLTKIIVKPGGKLIVNGGTITNQCGDF